MVLVFSHSPLMDLPKAPKLPELRSRKRVLGESGGGPVGPFLDANIGDREWDCQGKWRKRPRVPGVFQRRGTLQAPPT
ncbi:MAG: hypothetical protein DRH20_04175 [Deltaproteobacteria bacterium]|nr:MAG: hypothetical protein DRH20_04175 [Deltaproteobacteria bacterium]